MKTVKLIIDGKEIEAQVNEEDLKEVEKESCRKKYNEDYYSLDSFLQVSRIKEKKYFL